MREKLVAIAPFLRFFPPVTTLGVRASMADYTAEQREMLLSAGRVLFPTPRFVGILRACGKKTFPSALAYIVRRSRLMQEVLFQFFGCPHPVTRIYYGRQKSAIEKDFSFPFAAMGPRAQDLARPVLNACELKEVCGIYNPLIIQRMINYSKRFGLVFINYRCVGIIERVEAAGGAHRGFGGGQGRIALPGRGAAPESFSKEIVSCLERFLRSAQIDDAQAEIGIARRGWGLIELVRPPLSWPTPEGSANRYGFISQLIESGRF